jgi:crossover junction endodeoxyribonuclease RuvC
MGIDPSLTGFAMASSAKDDDFPLIVELASKPKSSALKARLHRYETFVSDIMEHVAECRPSLVMIEGYAYSRQGSVIFLGEFGILLRKALLEVTEVIEVSPSALKKFATGKGNANKAKVTSALASRFGMEFSTDNEADAFALLQIALMWKGWVQPQTKYQELALQQLNDTRDGEGGSRGKKKRAGV